MNQNEALPGDMVILPIEGKYHVVEITTLKTMAILPTEEMAHKWMQNFFTSKGQKIVEVNVHIDKIEEAQKKASVMDKITKFLGL